MTTITTTRRTELAHRSSGGVDVFLLWDEHTDRVSLGLVDVRTDTWLELDVEARDALDAFNHPFAYAARRG